VASKNFLIEDVLQPELRVVFCGTALGRVSLAQKAYYANPQNLFWATLHKTGMTPVLIAPQDYRRVLEFGIGLTDLGKTVFGNDHELPKGSLDAASLRIKIETYRPRILGFTSKNAGRAFMGSNVSYGWQVSPFSGTKIYVLPSTSPAARGSWKKNERHWAELADAVLSEAQ